MPQLCERWGCSGRDGWVRLREMDAVAWASIGWHAERKQDGSTQDGKQDGSTQDGTVPCKVGAVDPRALTIYCMVLGPREDRPRPRSAHGKPHEVAPVDVALEHSAGSHPRAGLPRRLRGCQLADVPTPARTLWGGGLSGQPWEYSGLEAREQGEGQGRRGKGDSQ